MTTPYEAAAAMAQQARKLEILSKLAAEMALERAVLTLTESGTDSREVAAATGVKRRKVESIKAAYGDHQVQRPRYSEHEEALLATLTTWIESTAQTHVGVPETTRVPEQAAQSELSPHQQIFRRPAHHEMAQRHTTGPSL
jgi:hypothetical protein